MVSALGAVVQLDARGDLFNQKWHEQQGIRGGMGVAHDRASRARIEASFPTKAKRVEPYDCWLGARKTTTMTPDYADAMFMAAPHFTPGRAGEAVEILVLHTAEQDCKEGMARSIARFFSDPSSATSAHYVVGPDAVFQCVQESATAWHARGANAWSIGMEHAARAAFSADQWSAPDALAMLRRSAQLAADICRRHGIPVEYVDATGLVARRRGITTHRDVSQAFQRSDHTDPGRNFPMSMWLQMVEDALC